nr:MAG TPA: hypothetical protein [Caudoviricetes sp.]
MKVIKYQLCTEVNRGTEDKPDIQQVFSTVTLGWSAANEKIAKAEAYNGEYTVEDNGEPEPVIPPTNDELAAENKLLKQQVSALTEQQSFYEDCIAEMAEVVYA